MLLVVQRDLSKDTTRYAFNNLTKIYEYADISDHIYQDIDIIFFDSEPYLNSTFCRKTHVKYIFDFLSDFETKFFLIKLSSLENNERDSLFYSIASNYGNIVLDKENAKIPWDIIYFNNAENSQSTLMIFQRCTACFSTYLFFEVKILLLRLALRLCSMTPIPSISKKVCYYLKIFLLLLTNA